MNILQRIANRLKTTFNLKQNKSEKNQPGGFAGLDSNGLIFESQMPSLSILDVYPVANETEMLALNASLVTQGKKLDKGDFISIEDSVNGDKFYIVIGEDKTVLSSFKLIKTPFETLLGSYSEFNAAFEDGLE